MYGGENREIYSSASCLTQGLNRQIRRMSEALGYKVTELVRVRIMNIRTGESESKEHTEN